MLRHDSIEGLWNECLCVYVGSVWAQQLQSEADVRVWYQPVRCLRQGCQCRCHLLRWWAALGESSTKTKYNLPSVYMVVLFLENLVY